MDVILVTAGALLVVALLWAGTWAVARWKGVWKSLAILVVFGAGSWGTKILFDLQRDPTLHNHWPFEVLGVATVALFVLGVMALARASVRHAS